MNYHKIYNSLMEKSHGRKKKQGTYYEKHHVLPKCLGGTNDKTNLVLLTAEEHWVAHLLLVKMHPEKTQLVYACQAMSMVGSKKMERVNNKMFGWIRRKYAESVSLRQQGVLKSKEVRDKISKSLKGRMPEHQKKRNVMKCPEVAKKVADANRGRSITFSNPKERGEKISKGKLGKPNSFLRDSNPNNIRVCCLGCNKETTYPIFKRSHSNH